MQFSLKSLPPLSDPILYTGFGKQFAQFTLNPFFKTLKTSKKFG